MLEEANNIKFNEPQRALDMANSAYLNSLKSGDEKAESISLHLMGVCYELISNYPEAMKFLSQAIKLSTMLGDKKKMADGLNTVGIINDNIGNHANALKTYFKALKIYEELNEPASKAIVLSNIGLVYTNIHDYVNALKFYSEANSLAEKLEDTESRLITYINMGLTYRLLNEYENSRTNLIKALTLSRDVNDRLRESLSLVELGDVEVSLGNTEEAKKYYEGGLKIKYEVDDKKGIASVHSVIGLMQFKEGQLSEAKENIKIGLKISEEIGTKQAVYIMHNLLSQIYEKENNTELAFKHYKISHEKQIEYLSEESDLKAKNLSIQNEVERALKETEIQRLRNVELAKALEEVNILNRNLKELNDEKNEFMGVAVHDLKNPLQNILSNARVLNRQKDITSVAVNEFTSNIIYQTDRMFNLIKKLLDHNAIEQGNIKIRKTIFEVSSFCEMIISDFADSASKKNIKVRWEDSTNNAPLFTDKDVLYQIIQNLISNAIKFSPENSEINFNVKSDEKDFIFEITDNGPGFTEKDKEKIFTKFSRLSAKPTGDEHSTGLGLSIVKKLTEIIDARLTYESEEGKGTKFTLKIKKPELE